MVIAQSSSTLLRRHLYVIVTRCHSLIKMARDPYRPELHYMRGPGPRWHAKLKAGTASINTGMNPAWAEPTGYSS
jgi:hypothetical protein